jgi:hypothetical protein
MEVILVKRLASWPFAVLVAVAFGIVSLFATVATPVFAQGAPAPQFGSPPSGEIPILYNDQHVYSKPDKLNKGRVLAALVRGKTILVPLRSMFEQMGATVSYNPSTKTVDVSKPGADVQVTVGKPEVVINGETRPLDVPPEIYRGTLVVPVRVISEGMGAYVLWVRDKHLVVVRYLPPPAPTPVPTAPPTPVPTVAPTSAATLSPRAPGTVSQSLLAVYNKRHPEHKRGAQFFGRYTYVLFSRASVAEMRDRAVIASLVGNYVDFEPYSISVGAPSLDENLWSYNLFLLPEKKSNADPLRYKSLDEAVTGLLKGYDWDAADRIRERYCNVAGHRNNKICSPVISEGPLLLTMIRPLSEVASSDFPPALALDLTNILPESIDNQVKQLTIVIEIPAPIEADTVLPPSWAASYVVPGLEHIATAITVAEHGVVALMDNFGKALLPH